MHFARQRSRHCRAAAAIGDVREFEFCRLIEHFLRQMCRHVAGAEVKSVGLGGSELEKIVECFCGHGGMYRHNVRLLDQLRDGRKVALDTERHLVVHPRRHGGGADFRDDQRVTVRVGLGADGRAAGALRAAAVVDQQLLPQCVGDRRLQDARHQIGAAAGRKGHDQTYRFGGVIGGGSADLVCSERG